VSDDPTRRGASDPWLRHELEDEPGGRDARQADEAWLRHDLTDPAGADGAGPAAGPVPAADAAGATAAYRPTGPAEDTTDPDRVGRTRPLPVVRDDWAVYAAAAPAVPEEEPQESRREARARREREAKETKEARDREPRRSTNRRHGFGAMLGAAGRELVIVVGMALVLSFVVKTWLLQAFYIPSGSMEDTLVLNDRVIVSKLTPGPFDLKRGDIVVFADPGDWLDSVTPPEQGPVVTTVRKGLMFVGLLPDDAENHLIKRVIGLPGDRVVCCDEGERLTVNGVPLVEPYLKPGDAPSAQEFDIRVPEGSVWVMGDHRSDSSDSRYHDPSGTGEDGSVPESLIVGRAVALVWPLNHLDWLSNPRATFAKVPDAPTGGSAPAGGSPPERSPAGGGAGG
jgi:signal peptidase I